MQCVILRAAFITFAAKHVSAHQVQIKSTTEHAAAHRWRVDALCGNWMSSYAELHRAIRAGERAPRYVMVDPMSGLSDSLACIGSAFYLALLTDRAFVIDESVEADRFSTMYQSHYIDWKSDLHEVAHLSNFTIYGLRTIGDPLEGYPFDVFRRGDLKSLGANADVIYVNRCNGGIVVPLFDNALYRLQLFRMGLRPETAYGCMFNFLFDILPTVRDMFAREISIMEDSSSIKIGIQIRTGDETLNHQRLSVEDPSEAEAVVVLGKHAEIFRCADAIERRIIKGSNKPIVWFLLSDSVLLRKSAIVIYGSKILTNLEGIQNLKHLRTYGGGGGAPAMMYAAGEHWLFSRADYHVFKTGAFGKSAALASLKWDFYYVPYLGCKPSNAPELTNLLPGV